MPDPHRLDDGFDGDPVVILKSQLIHVRAGVGLMTGHGGGPIVKDDQRKVVIVVNRVGQPRHAGVKKGGITDKRDGFLR